MTRTKHGDVDGGENSGDDISYPVVRREGFGAIGIHISSYMRSDSELPRASQPHTSQVVSFI